MRSRKEENPIMQAMRYTVEADAKGNVPFPALHVQAGASVEIIILVPDADEETNDLLTASASSLDFWDNPIDDKVWNNA